MCFVDEEFVETECRPRGDRDKIRYLARIVLVRFGETGHLSKENSAHGRIQTSITRTFIPGVPFLEVNPTVPARPTAGTVALAAPSCHSRAARNQPAHPRSSLPLPSGKPCADFLTCSVRLRRLAGPELPTSGAARRPAGEAGWPPPPRIRRRSRRSAPARWPRSARASAGATGPGSG